MLKISRVSAATTMALGLSACALSPPDPLPLVQNCRDAPIILPDQPDQSLSFFYSTTIPDCSAGGLTLVPFRHTEPTFGSGIYATIEEDPQDPVLTKHGEDAWLDALTQAVETPDASKRLIVFIHGYATSFEEAHMDAVEVRALAGEDVPIVLLHWPSSAKASAYISDRASIAWAQDDITRMIARISRIADDVTLVSHSLGGKALTEAVIALDRDPIAKSESIRRIVLASPDIDRHQALRRGGVIDRLLTTERKVLVYASRKDRALQLSRNLNGYARLGSTNCEFDVVFNRRALGKDGNCHLIKPRDGLAIVDTGLSDAEGVVRHNDFLKSCQVREDLRAFLRDEEPPPYRIAVESDGLQGFAISPIMDFEGAPCEPIMKG